jgi:protease-4
MRLFRTKRDCVAVIRVEGVIADSDSFGAGRAKVIGSLDTAERRGSQAVVLRINSPGGSVAACQEIFAAILRLREKKIPVVASMGDVAASGGVYISMAADEIVANAGTVTGSIGVIIRSSNLSDLYHKVGISPKVIKSGPHKDMLATYRSFSKDEEALLQGVINDTHLQFVEAVASARKKLPEEIAPIADGRILTGRQAMEAGLIDWLGDLDFAIRRAASLAGIKGKPRIDFIVQRKRFWQRVAGPFRGYGERALSINGLAGIPLWLLPTL